jgi:hypothetical protein
MVIAVTCNDRRATVYTILGTVTDSVYATSSTGVPGKTLSIGVRGGLVLHLYLSCMALTAACMHWHMCLSSAAVYNKGFLSQLLNS